MSEDIRVILIKMADRLHNMRTLSALSPGKQYKIAGETMYLYAPLAHRLGLNRIKTELEELSFKYEHPEAYQQITQKLALTAESRKELYHSFIEPIRHELDKLNLKYYIKDRVKTAYSIWNKMTTKNIQFEEIYDLLAVRIIFDYPEHLQDEKEMLALEKKQCWDIYSTITNIYKPHPDRLRDWVNNPKANGYQALHTTVMGFTGDWIEIQIRSTRMNNIAERGFAAHWKYKLGEIEEDNELNHWILTIKEILESPEPNTLDVLNTIKMNLFSSEIFVFTPKGEIKTLAQGATALDFAFELHSELGYRCIGAKVNHKLVPMSHVLKSGDQVEILTSDNQTPQYDWLKFVTTGKAHSKIKARFRKENRESIKKGEELLSEFFNKLRLPADADNLQVLLTNCNCLNKDELLLKLGTGELELDSSESELFKKDNQNLLVKYWKLTFGSKTKQEKETKKVDLKTTHQLTEESVQSDYHLSDCCQPIPGDAVLGYVAQNGFIYVHKRQCPIAMRLKSSDGDRIVSAEWATHKKLSFAAEIEIIGLDTVGMINQITRVVSDEFSVNMNKLNSNRKTDIQRFLDRLRARRRQPEPPLHQNLQIKNIKSVTRVEHHNRLVAEEE
jgi:GTP pyrophosphokinase